MAEEGKPTQGLNLGALKTNAAGNQTDLNSNSKADNADQTAEGAPVAPESTEPQTNAGDVSPEEAASSNLQKELDVQRAVNVGPVTQDNVTLYSTHPIQTMRLGGFRGENTVIRVPNDKVEQFEKLVSGLPESEQRKIRKLDVERAEAIVRDRQASKEFDSGMGREAMLRLQATAPTVGMADIAHAANPQTDNNVPQIPQPAVDPEGKTGLDQGSHTAPDGVDGGNSAV